MRRPQRRRHDQQGQVLVLTALMGTVLIGVAALAVDLSMQTGNRRTLQNLTDIAALAGARDLYATSATISGTDQTDGVLDALHTVQQDMGWPDAWLASTNPCSLPATYAQFGLTGLCTQVVYRGYTVTVSTPPASPRSAADMDSHDLQVDITQTAPNGFAGVIGVDSSQAGGHAVANHATGGTNINFALFSNTYVQAGNSSELVQGNVYANRAVQLQSNGGGQTFCAASTGADDGYVILGAPQTAASGGQPAQLHASSITPTSSCSTLSPPGVFQAGADVRNSPPSCPTNIDGLPGGLTYDSTVRACVSLPITPPTAAPPPLAGNVRQIAQPCNGGGNGNGHHGSGFPSCWPSSTAVNPGLYVVTHTCSVPSCSDLLINAPMCLQGVSFWLKPGAVMTVNMTGNTLNGDCPKWTTAQVPAVEDSGPYNAGTGQSNDGRYVVFGEGGSTLNVAGANNALEFDTGSIYMPGGTVSGSSSTSALLLDAGQAITDTWNVSTGAQPNPQITYSGPFAVVSQETLRLVE